MAGFALPSAGIRVAATCAAVLTCLPQAGCSFLTKGHFFRGQAPPAERIEAGEPRKTVYVVSNGWHAGLVLRCAEIDPRDLPERGVLAHRRYLEIGWGDEGFYRARTLTLGVTARAIFLPSPSVLHLVGFDHRPDRLYAGADVVELKVDEAGYRRMCRHIHDSFAVDERGRPQRLGPGMYGESHFFRARGKYYFPKTCNVWTAATLKTAGVPIVPALCATAGGVVRQARAHGRMLSKSSPGARLRALQGHDAQDERRTP